MNKIYITSDLHFCHDVEFIYKPRGFTSITEHDETIVKNWNALIDDEDDVYILGDLILVDIDKGMEYLRQLHGKLHIVLGNHDSAKRVEQYKTLDRLSEICGYSTVLKYQKYTFYLSHYPSITTNYDDDKPLRARVLNICGHVHQKEKWDKDIPMSYHVELDAHHNMPVLLDDIISDFKEYITQK